MEQIIDQQKIHDRLFSNVEKYSFHITNDPLIRYLRDRRLNYALSYLYKIYEEDTTKLSVLIICGGVGGEALFFKRMGFSNIVNSDLSLEAAKTSKALDSTLRTDYVNAESLPYESNTFDLVVVQDGLHHLPRPVLGFNEMLRVAKNAVVVIEPKESLIGNLIGTQFEKIDDVENYVFRWSKYCFQAAARSYLLRNIDTIAFISLWDHNVIIRKTVSLLPKKIQLFWAKIIYSFLGFFSFFGNMMIGIVIKNK